MSLAANASKGMMSKQKCLQYGERLRLELRSMMHAAHVVVATDISKSWYILVSWQLQEEGFPSVHDEQVSRSSGRRRTAIITLVVSSGLGKKVNGPKCRGDDL